MTTSIDIDALRATLTALPPKAITQPTARDIITALAPELKVAIRERGYTYADLAEKLEAGGLKISASTLGSYLRAAGQAQASSRPVRPIRRNPASKKASVTPQNFSTGEVSA
ncbi:hypothetical protein SAMN04489859_10833 [Paracoccus alcaliphilus]|uniref:Uncharacterized protein n=1 Tax=Paracoccus alcaliphilus TaxID=34002 RepID=A0A1H8P7C8_9RHOB|nr:hypothetical protein [Paracoccus alcaliphilus]WCR20894.1 hypothetical protein JHW40_23210 [Paracoccus alcaliphilus]SEO37707.1 hypothetical protein SAMN04489859_10833 [Paracoccus alcaliphilus]